MIAVDKREFWAYADKHYVGTSFSVKSTGYTIKSVIREDGKVFFDVTKITKAGKISDQRIGFDDIKEKQIVTW